MSVQTLLAELVAEAEKLFTHADPAVPAAAQSIVAKAEQIKTEVVADGKALLTQAEQDGAKIASDATGSGGSSSTATPAK